MLLQLPRPLEFGNLTSLQFFPGYPLTQKAIEDGFIKAQDINIDSLMKRTATNYQFKPKLFPLTRKCALQNIIWLIAFGYIKDERFVRYSVFGDSLRARLCFIYLNFKAIVLGKLFGVGGMQHRFRLRHIKKFWSKYFIKLN